MSLTSSIYDHFIIWPSSVTWPSTYKPTIFFTKNQNLIFFFGGGVGGGEGDVGGVSEGGGGGGGTGR